MCVDVGGIVCFRYVADEKWFIYETSGCFHKIVAPMGLGENPLLSAPDVLCG